MYSVRIHIIEMLIFSPNVETNCHCNVETKCHQISPICGRNHFQVWRKIRIFVITTFGDKTLRTFLLLSIFVHHETKSLLLKQSCGRDFKHLWTLLTALQGHYIVIVLHDYYCKAITLSRFVWLFFTVCCQMSLKSIVDGVSVTRLLHCPNVPASSISAASGRQTKELTCNNILRKAIGKEKLETNIFAILFGWKS